MRPNRRTSSAQSLLEMVIAIAMSGFFIALLSGMLSQTLTFSNTSQDDLIAQAAADLLVENARNVPYPVWSLGTATFVMNKLTASDVGENPRNFPVQLDFTDPTNSNWATVTNFLKNATVTETVADGQPVTGLSSYQIDISVQYPVSSGKKSLNRTIYVFEDGQ